MTYLSLTQSLELQRMLPNDHLVQLECFTVGKDGDI